MEFEEYLKSIDTEPIQVIDWAIPISDYVAIDLSTENAHLDEIDLTSPEECQNYVDNVLGNTKKVAFGGYLEKRGLYAQAERFTINEQRDIHLGVDFWCSAGTQVIVPLDGQIHSFANNSDKGNYGPTIILKHQWGSNFFYTLYGHLSLESLEGIYERREFKKGEALATLGTPDINVNYAPHLHFQIIRDIGDFCGDYPGVCSSEDLSYFRKNCPDPNLLLKVNSGMIDEMHL
nr:peptidoglycan DD-metalloendopeptidase family protein [Allomuricauda sp.]